MEMQEGTVNLAAFYLFSMMQQKGKYAQKKKWLPPT